MDRIKKDKKNNLAGQMALFDIAADEQKDEFDIKMPDIGEYDKEMRLAFEKEVLGIYVSGHPLEEYSELWQRTISNKTSDFLLDEETQTVSVKDQSSAIIGGLISNKTIKYTKNDKVMAFITVEDLVGTVEVIVFPNDYEKYGHILIEDAKVFVRGRVSVEEDKDGKLISEKIASFDEVGADANVFKKGLNRRGFSQSYYGENINSRMGNTNFNTVSYKTSGGGNAGISTQVKTIPSGVWIQFNDAEEYESRKQQLLDAIADSDGKDNVVVYLKRTKGLKILPGNLQVQMGEPLKAKLSTIFGEENVKFVTKPIENKQKKG